jgi:hypothetical protein
VVALSQVYIFCCAVAGHVFPVNVKNCCIAPGLTSLPRMQKNKNCEIPGVYACFVNTESDGCDKFFGVRRMKPFFCAGVYIYDG